MNTRKRAICKNCKSRYTAGDKYCRYCGAPMGNPEYIDDRFSVIYGPPYSEMHECKKCGYSWESSGLGVDRQQWCPRCGGEAPSKND